MEPSCLAVLRDELVEMFPHDEDARRLAQQSFTLAELLTQRTDGYRAPEIQGRLAVHGHCHHTSVLGFDADRELIESTGADVDFIPSGCCGMAGAFGFEADKYDVSVAVGEQVLLPTVRDAAETTVVVADGFSCRTQIDDLTDRQPLHLAQVLDGATRARGSTPGVNGSSPPG